MKIITLIVAALTAVSGLAPVAAQAQRTVVHERTVVREHDRGFHAARRVCHTEFRHHRRVQVCRTVRR